MPSLTISSGGGPGWASPEEDLPPHHLPVLGDEEAGDGPKGGGLPRPVRAQEGGDPPFGDLEGDPPEHLDHVVVDHLNVVDEEEDGAEVLGTDRVQSVHGLVGKGPGAPRAPGVYLP